ncbi:hypothetical protein [Lapillicoccus sp.]|nr:hypothetical protein [Lapillicoccus sp.]
MAPSAQTLTPQTLNAVPTATSAEASVLILVRPALRVVVVESLRVI